MQFIFPWQKTGRNAKTAFGGENNAACGSQETEFILQGRVVRKPVNVNPGLNRVNWRIMFSCLKMFFTFNVWCSLRLLQLKTEGQTI